MIGAATDRTPAAIYGEEMSLLPGHRYNRTKGAQGGDKKSTGQNVRLIDNAAALAAEHGVNEKTIRRDGEFAEAVETVKTRPHVADNSGATAEQVEQAGKVDDGIVKVPRLPPDDQMTR